MKDLILTSLLVLIFNLTYGQLESRTFIHESRTFEIMKKYSVSEITIFSDSTYVQKFHKLDDKGQRNNYKHFDYNLTGGKFKKKGDFYAFSQIGTDSLLDDHFRIKKEKLTYYYQKGNGRFKKGAVFKEVENQPQRPIDYIREIFDYVYYRYLDKDLVSESKTVEIKYGDYISGRINLKITEFFYPDTKELVRLKIASGDYPEYTDNYFYNNGELVFAESWIDNEKYNGEKVKLFIRDGKPLNKPKAKKKIFQQIIESANNYMMDYRKASSQE